MESFEEIVSLVKEYCQSKVSNIAYTTWLKVFEPLRFEHDTAYICVRTTIQYNVLNGKYRGLLLEAFTEVMGFRPKLEIICTNALDEETPKDRSPERMNRILQDSYEASEYEYTFETFIVGSSNNLAYAACKAVADNCTNVTRNYNPLFIYGPSGLGKTHLIHAIYNEVHIKHPELKVKVITGHNFTSDIVNSLQDKTIDQVREKYLSLDILMIDDVHFLAGKERCQEEFFLVFNEFYLNNKQIILTSDRPPKDMKSLEERVKSRFESGLMSDIQLPDYETRVAIIKRKAELMDLHIPDDVADFLANRLKNNIRQMEGAVKKLQAHKLLTGSPPTVRLAQTVIRDILSDDQPIPMTVERIIEEVARTYQVEPEDMRSQKRSAPISKARQAAIYIIKEITNLTFEDIGKEFSGRDHSSMVYARDQVVKKMEEDAHYREIIGDIIKNIKTM